MANLSESQLYKKLATAGHKHFCSDRECRTVYDCLDVAFLHRCAEPRRNGRCQSCREVVVPAWSAGQQVQDCCANNVRQVIDRAELLAHRLAGPGPWFKCKTCARCSGWPQGINNKKENGS